MHNVSLAILGLLSCAACAPDHVASPVVAPSVVAGFAAPESVVLAGDRRYVSNIGQTLEPLAKDGDGFISELDASGAIRDLRAFAPLDAPKGMAVVGDVLYVADIDRVIGFDRTSHARVFEAASPHPEHTLLNDLAVESDSSLLVSDTLASAVYRLRLADRTLTALATGIAGANGIVVAPGGAVAYVVGIGAQFDGGDLFAVDLATGAAHRLGTAHGLFDGVAILASGELVISDWVALDHPVAGTLSLYATDGRFIRALALPEPLHGPADFAYDAAHHQLWIPRSLDGSVSIVRLATSG